ncbi:MAG TPA: hypothetical protein VEO20_01700 [Thermoplasmata archaeon]|nr:hypothetical protein [Thermoplasmata archaeon]
MVAWEEILRRQVQAYEERKREYVRWTATGLAVIGALSGVLLQNVASVRFGSHFYVSLWMLFLAGYLIAELVWQLAEEKIAQAVTTLIGGRRPARAWDLVNAPADVAKMSFWRVAWALGPNMLITIILALIPSSVNTTASGSLTRLALFRFVTIVIWVITFLIYRSRKGELPTAAMSRIGGFLVGKVIVILYYAIQLWLVASAFRELAVPGLQEGGLALIVLVITGVLTCGLLIWRIAWPLVNHNAAIMGAFMRVHEGVLVGRLADTEAVFDEVSRIYSGSSPPRNEGTVSTGTPDNSA